MLEIRKKRLGKQRTIHERQRHKRTIIRVFITILVLVLLFVVGAIVYVWYMGQKPNEQAVQTIDTRSAAPTIKTYKPADDAPVGIVQESFTGSAAPGANATISIKTNPGAACQIAVKVNNTPLPDTGLIPKIADEFGIVNWSWSIPANVVPGKWPVEITCANEAKKSAYYKAELVVAR